MNCISLFSGAGGADIGFEKAGLKIIVSQDFEKDCVQTQKLKYSYFIFKIPH